MTGAPDWLPPGWIVERLDSPPPFSLSATCGPVAWGGGRWPDQDWVDGRLIWYRADDAGTWLTVCWQERANGPVAVATADPLTITRREALRDSLGLDRAASVWADPVIAGLADRFPGLRPFCHGSLYLGLVTSIVGQSISVASAAITQRRLAASLAEPVTLAGRSFWPLPAPTVLAGATVEAVRASGVTWRRAEALVAVAVVAARHDLADESPAWATMPANDRIAALRSYPLIGPWTARSALLWGTAEAGVWPEGDVALLRAARLAYGRPELELRGLADLAAGWAPDPGWASRLLWAGLFGSAPATMDHG